MGKKGFKLISAAGVKPKVIVLTWTQAQALEAQIHVRYGINNHKIYHMRTNPPPEGVEVKANDSCAPEAIKEQHRNFELILGVTDACSVLLMPAVCYTLCNHLLRYSVGFWYCFCSNDKLH